MKGGKIERMTHFMYIPNYNTHSTKKCTELNFTRALDILNKEANKVRQIQETSRNIVIEVEIK